MENRPTFQEKFITMYVGDSDPPREAAPVDMSGPLLFEFCDKEDGEDRLTFVMMREDGALSFGCFVIDIGGEKTTFQLTEEEQLVAYRRVGVKLAETAVLDWHKVTVIRPPNQEHVWVYLRSTHKKLTHLFWYDGERYGIDCRVWEGFFSPGFRGDLRFGNLKVTPDEIQEYQKIVDLVKDGRLEVYDIPENEADDPDGNLPVQQVSAPKGESLN